MTVRLQYEILSRWNGNQRGSSMISTGITGTALQGMTPNSASISARKDVGVALRRRVTGSPRAPAPYAGRQRSLRSS